MFYDLFMQKILFYMPRILAILLIIFISIFALDVFSEGYSVLELVVALFMHLLPSLLLLLLTFISWKRPKPGAVLFVTAGIVAGFFFNPSDAQMPINLYAASPLFLIGILFSVIKI